MSPHSHTPPAKPDRIAIRQQDAKPRPNLDQTRTLGHRLLNNVLDSVVRDLPESLAAALTIRDTDADGPGQLRNLADWGCGALLVALQTGHASSPVHDAAVRPVISPNLWNDPRWPRLTLASAWTHRPEQFSRLRPIRGVAAMSITGEAGGEIVLSVALPSSADNATLQTLRHHEPVITSAVGVLELSLYNSRNAANAFSMARSRAVIEQAKGIVMSLRGCAADQAWRVLRESSCQLNVKVRNLAEALVEYIADPPADQGGDATRNIIPSKRDRQAAAVLWRVLHDCHRPDGLATISLLPIPGADVNGSNRMPSGVRNEQPVS